MRSPIYFMLVRLEDGDLASLTIIREPAAFFAQLVSYGFMEHASASSTLLRDMQTAAFFDTVADVFSVRVPQNRPFTYMVPDGMSRDDWLAAMEEKARDPRFMLVERDGEISHCIIVPRLR